MKAKFLFTGVIGFLFLTPELNAYSSKLELEGRASDCARMARSLVLTTAEAVGDDPNGENFQGWIALYNSLYTACYES